MPGEMEEPRLQEPAKILCDAELDQVAAGKTTPVKANGNANGVPAENQNPAGQTPPGQN